MPRKKSILLSLGKRVKTGKRLAPVKKEHSSIVARTRTRIVPLNGNGR